MNSRSSGRHRQGRITDFDDAAGYGTITDEQGEWFFHCTEIADGSRQIEEKAEVAFVLGAGHLGRWEARDIRST